MFLVKILYYLIVAKLKTKRDFGGEVDLLSFTSKVGSSILG